MMKLLLISLVFLFGGCAYDQRTLEVESDWGWAVSIQEIDDRGFEANVIYFEGQSFSRNIELDTQVPRICVRIIPKERSDRSLGWVRMRIRWRRSTIFRSDRVSEWKDSRFDLDNHAIKLCDDK